MARPVKVFQKDEANAIACYLYEKFRNEERFAKNLNFSRQDEDWTEKVESLKTKIEALYLSKEDVSVPLRIWIDSCLSSDGWARIQAAMRQAKVDNSDDVVAKMSMRASFDLDKLSESAGMTKKAYLSLLMDWMTRNPIGKKAAKDIVLFIQAARTK